MKKDTIIADPAQSSTILPYQVRQAVVGIELGPTDKTVLSYLSYLTDLIPFQAAHFAHVVPRFDAYRALNNKNLAKVIGQYEYGRDSKALLKEKIEQTKLDDEQMHISYDVLEGDPLEQLLKLNEEIGSSLLVVGQKARAESHGVLAKNLARKTPTDALLLPQGVRNRLKTLLVPVDFSPSSAKALQRAIAIKKNKPQDIRIICLYVYEFPDFKNLRFNKPWLQVKSLVEENIQDAFAAFLDTHAGADKSDVKTMAVFRDHQDLGSHILRVAGDERADMILMGARGHSKVRVLLMGSVAERVVDGCERVPIMLIR